MLVPKLGQPATAPRAQGMEHASTTAGRAIADEIDRRILELPGPRLDPIRRVRHE